MPSKFHTTNLCMNFPSRGLGRLECAFLWLSLPIASHESHPLAPSSPPTSPLHTRNPQYGSAAARPNHIFSPSLELLDLWAWATVFTWLCLGNRGRRTRILTSYRLFRWVRVKLLFSSLYPHRKKAKL